MPRITRWIQFVADFSLRVGILIRETPGRVYGPLRSPSAAFTRRKVIAVKLKIQCYRGPEGKTEESALTPLHCCHFYPPKNGFWRGLGMRIRLLNSFHAQKRHFKYSGVVFSGGTGSGVGQNCHHRRLNPHTDAVLECFSMFLSPTIFHRWIKAAVKMLHCVYV